MIDIKKVVNMQEDEISEYIEGLGLESAFDEGGFLKRIWGKLSTTRFLVGHVNAALNELKSLEKIDVKKIKEDTTEHSISALDLRVIEDAMDIVEIGKGIPERLQSHAMRAFEIIKKIDKKIFMAKDATDTIGKVVSPKFMLLNNIFKLCIMGYRMDVVADMYEIDTKDKAPFPMALYPLVEGAPKWLKKGFRKFNRCLTIFGLTNMALGILATLISVIQTSRVDEFMDEKDVKYLKDFYKVIYTDLSVIYKSVITRNGHSILDRLDEIIVEKRTIPWTYEQKVKFAEYMKDNAGPEIESLKRCVTVLNGSEYKVVSRTTKAIISASYKLNGTTQEIEKFDRLVEMMEANLTILYKVLEAYTKMIKEMRKF